MEKKKIYLNTQEQLRIYMSPQRQNLLRVLRLAGRAMTAKEIAEHLRISASSAQLHIRKLVQLEILEVDHTESINGITATYFRLADADVFIGLGKNDELFEERDAVAQNLLMQIYKNSRDMMRKAPDVLSLKELRRQCCDSRSGTFYLKPEDIERLESFIDCFIEEHATQTEGAVPWEWALILYNTRYHSEKGGENENA